RCETTNRISILPSMGTDAYRRNENFLFVDITLNMVDQCFRISQHWYSSMRIIAIIVMVISMSSQWRIVEIRCLLSSGVKKIDLFAVKHCNRRNI
uniref:SH2 domain-containing protein n=1 Tax=Parascaris univalens TaxID=6257 RepID=A0A914ZIA5_PARUN